MGAISRLWAAMRCTATANVELQSAAKTGTENYGGPVVTAGGLVFIAASRDEHLRAFDRRTGRELWRAKLPERLS